MRMRTQAKVTTTRIPLNLWVEHHWRQLGDALEDAIQDDLRQGVKPSTGRRMPKYREGDRQGERITLHRTGKLFRSFRVRARDTGVTVTAEAFYGRFLDLRFRFMSVPKSFGKEADDIMGAALRESLDDKTVRQRRTKRKRRRRK